MARWVGGVAAQQIRTTAPAPSPPQPKARRPAKSEAPVRLPAPAAQATGMQLYTPEGARKYLTAAERDGFLHVAEQGERTIRTLCMTLVYSGCRLSEALALTVDRVDLGADIVVFESLKKRRDGIYRAVLVPPS